MATLRGRQRHRLGPRAGLLLVLAATFLVFAPSLANGFASDGRVLAQIEGNATPNELVRTLRPLGEYFSVHYWHGVGEPSNLYRPVTILSYALTRRFLGGMLGDAEAQHLVNLLLHVLATWLVYRLLRAARAGHGPALAAALVFGLHAIHSEVVAGIVGRAELLAFVGGAAGLLFGLGGADREGWRSLASNALAGSLFFIGCAAKESAVAWLPFAVVFVLARAWQAGGNGTSSVRAPLLTVLGCAVVPLAGYLLLRDAALQSVPAPSVFHVVNPLHGLDAGPRVATALVVWAYGLGKTIVPIDLCSDYGAHTFALRLGFGDPVVLASLALLLAILAAGVLGARRRPLLLLAVAAFFGFGFATSNLAFTTGTIFGERLYYAPSLSLSFAVAFFWQRGLPRWALAAGVGWVALSVAVIVERNQHWRDEEALVFRDVEVNPHSARLQTAVAGILATRGATDDALVHQRRAIEIEPRYAGAWINLGSMLLQNGDPAGAEQALLRALEAPYRQQHEAPILRLNLARVYWQTDRPAEAARILIEAVELSPGDPSVLAALVEAARGLEGRGRPGDALAAYRAVRAAPGLDPARRAEVDAAIARLR